MRTVEEKLKSLAPVLGDAKARKLLLLYLMEDDFRARKELECHIDLLVSRHVQPGLDEPLILPPPELPGATNGLRLGQVEYLGKPCFGFTLQLRDLNRHLGIFGSTGSGKTTLAFSLLRQLHSQGIPFLILDWEQSYRGLAMDLGIDVFTAGQDASPLYLNPFFKPEGIKVEEYIKSLIALFAEDYLSGAGSDTMLLKYIREVYEEKDRPVFTDLVERVAKAMGTNMRGRQMLWKETVGRIVGFIARGGISEVVCSGKHMPVHLLLERPCVVELGGIKSPRDRKFIIHLLLNWIALHLEHRGIQGDSLKHVLLMEEFHNISMRTREDNLVSTLFRECRKYGLGLVALDQTPSEIPNAVFANMNTKVSFTLATSQDMTSMARAMNLDQDRQAYLGRLETGQAIVSIRQSLDRPFLLRASHDPQLGNPTEAELRQFMENRKALSGDSGSLCASILQPGPIQSSQDIDTSPPSRGLSALERCVIADIITHPFDGVDARCKRLGLHPGQMKELHDGLVRRKVLQPVNVAGLKLFDFTPEGRDVSAEAGLAVPSGQIRGGVEHRYVVFTLRDHLASLGMVPRCEVNDIDLVAEEQGVAVEVETGKSNIYVNIAKLLRSPHAHKYMIATRKETAIMLKRVVSSYPGITVLHFKDFLKLTRDQIIPS